MNPPKIWANYGVADLKRTAKFYSALGFKSNGSSDELTSFFFGNDAFVIHFFLKDILAKNTSGRIISSDEGNEIIFTLSSESKEDVDNWSHEIEKAGGSLVSRPEEFGAGYYGFIFMDPDGHKFNVFHM